MCDLIWYLPLQKALDAQRAAVTQMIAERQAAGAQRLDLFACLAHDGADAAAGPALAPAELDSNLQLALVASSGKPFRARARGSRA